MSVYDIFQQVQQGKLNIDQANQLLNKINLTGGEKNE
jgi:hypothetical protein